MEYFTNHSGIVDKPQEDLTNHSECIVDKQGPLQDIPETFWNPNKTMETLKKIMESSYWIIVEIF